MSMTTLGTMNSGNISEHPISERDTAAKFRTVQQAVELAADEHGMVKIRLLASAQKSNPALNQAEPQDRVVLVRRDIAIQRINQGIAELVAE
jgi:hypothetical protein